MGGERTERSIADARLFALPDFTVRLLCLAVSREVADDGGFGVGATDSLAATIRLVYDARAEPG